jgi:prepilin-type processing-associated H-X9-DG protein/prepilin-type N-terminal cleavage/methylation domain-containing protein
VFVSKRELQKNKVDKFQERGSLLANNLAGAVVMIPCQVNSRARLRRVQPTREGAPGFTVIELLTTLAIISLLLTLLVPAVLSVRSAARRMHCQSNLKQIGLALEQYSSESGEFPMGGRHKKLLLPYLDQRPLWDRLVAHSISSDELRGIVLPIYRCPADSAPDLVQVHKPTSNANYVACYGSGALKYGFNGVFQQGSYRLGVNAGVKLSEMTRGRSNIAAMSEWLCQDGTRQRLRYLWHTPRELTDVNQFEEFAQLCDSIPPSPAAYGYPAYPAGSFEDGEKGLWWTQGSLSSGGYNHVLTPNRPSCYNGDDVIYGAYTASSLHGGGVNVLYADGHVVFVSESIDTQVWRVSASRKVMDGLQQY